MPTVRSARPLFAALVSAAILAGCGGGGSDAADQAADTTAPTEATATDDGAEPEAAASEEADPAGADDVADLMADYLETSRAALAAIDSTSSAADGQALYRDLRDALFETDGDLRKIEVADPDLANVVDDFYGTARQSIGVFDEITTADLSRRVQVPASRDELQALAESMNETIERLERGVEAQRRFTSDAAHELRSPLAGMRAVLEVGQRQPERMASSVDSAIEQVDRAGRLVDDLLVLARHDAAATPRRRQLADVDDLVRAEVRAAADRFPDVRFDRVGITPVQSSVVATAIGRVVQNLVDNAASHARGVVRVRLGVVTAPDPTGRPVVHWELAVDDDGPGVPVADRVRVFERFARLDESRSRRGGGTGLGLAIVHDLVAEHGGSVAVDDSDLGGATFVVRVPVPLPG